MKRALFLLVLCMPIWVQAQTWFNFESRTVTNPEFLSDPRTQTIEVYNNDYVIAAGKEYSKQYSRFTAWDNTLTNMVTSFVLDTGYFVSDLSILGDKVYFCGKHVDTNNVSHGIIGVFDADDLISGSTFNYGIATISNVKSVNRLDTYYTGTNPIVSHIVAIGEPSTITQGMYPTCFISMHDSASVAFNIDVQSPTTQTQYYTEQLKDIIFTGAHVVTVSFVSPSEGFIIRLYNPVHPEDNTLQQSYYYDLSNTVDALALLNNEYAFNIAKITKNTIAVASSAGRNNNYFTLVNIIDITTSHAIVSNQAIVHPDKMIEIFDMEYDPIEQKLLLLENSNLSGNGDWLQSVTILTPSQTPMYIAPTNYLTHNSFLNDMEVLNAPYYLVGGISYATGYHQLFHTKDIASSIEYCNNKVDVKVVALPLGTVSNEQILNNYPGASHQWTIKQVGSVTKPITVNCKKEN